MLDIFRYIILKPSKICAILFFTGKKITLKLTDPTDLNRDLLKSETCSIAIPELEFEMGGGALGGRYRLYYASGNKKNAGVYKIEIFLAPYGDDYWGEKMKKRENGEKTTIKRIFISKKLKNFR